jgi:predicted Zn-ribbon and HTH transcriptional regulator
MELKVNLVVINERLDKILESTYGPIPKKIEYELVDIQADIDTLTNHDCFICPNCDRIVKHLENNPDNCGHCGASLLNDGKDRCPKCLLPDNDCECPKKN